MEKEKYFVPEISDLRIGYECEADISFYTNAPKPTWNKNIFTGVGQEIIKYHAWGMYRTKYLTKAQIESEGWKFNGTGVIGADNKEIEVYNQKNYGLRKYKNEFITIAQFKENQLMDILYKGSCKSINELRQIQKLLEI